MAGGVGNKSPFSELKHYPIDISKSVEMIDWDWALFLLPIILYYLNSNLHFSQWTTYYVVSSTKGPSLKIGIKSTIPRYPSLRIHLQGLYSFIVHFTASRSSKVNHNEARKSRRDGKKNICNPYSAGPHTLQPSDSSTMQLDFIWTALTDAIIMIHKNLSR